MANKFILVLGLFLCGCSHYEYHGHYKFDETKLVQKITKQKVIELYGAPLTFRGIDDVFYYAYSKNEISSFGFNSCLEAKILRLEFKDDVLVKSEVMEYSSWIYDSERTAEPKMEIDAFGEMMSNIGKMKGVDEGSASISEVSQTNAPTSTFLKKQ